MEGRLAAEALLGALVHHGAGQGEVEGASASAESMNLKLNQRCLFHPDGTAAGIDQTGGQIGEIGVVTDNYNVIEGFVGLKFAENVLWSGPRCEPRADRRRLEPQVFAKDCGGLVGSHKWTGEDELRLQTGNTGKKCHPMGLVDPFVSQTPPGIRLGMMVLGVGMTKQSEFHRLESVRGALRIALSYGVCGGLSGDLTRHWKSADYQNAFSS